jgi:hypothetical protein
MCWGTAVVYIIACEKQYRMHADVAQFGSMMMMFIRSFVSGM